jgi:hypothetical protein
MPCTTSVNSESVSLWVSVASLVVSLAATWVARSSLSQAQQVADRDQRDWRQRKWFDLYFKASEVCDSFEHFQAIYDISSMGTEGFVKERNELMMRLRRMFAMAAVFPQNSTIAALMKCAIGLKDPVEVLSRERLKKLGDAVEGLRERAFVKDASVLD